MATVLDETRDHSGDTPFFGDDGVDPFVFTIPAGQQYDRVELKILQQTNGSAAIAGAPIPGQVGALEIKVRWWYDAGAVRGRIKYQVVVSSAALDQAMDSRFLDVREASAAGATFRHNIEANSAGRPFHRLGVGDWLDPDWSDEEWTYRRPGPLFMADLGFLWAVHGIKAQPEAFVGFTLKNGWTIRSITLNRWDFGKSAFRWMTKPAIGSNNPYMQAQVEAEPMGSYVRVGVAILIQGPLGRDPYRG